MYGILSFQQDSDGGDVTEVQIADAEPGGDADIKRLTEDDRTEEAPPGTNPIETGLVYLGNLYGEDSELTAVCVFYDADTGTWWTEESGSFPADEVL